MKLADDTYWKIKEGSYDPKREGSGITLGSIALEPKSGKRVSRGCC
jgi:hypothetical protein